MATTQSATPPLAPANGAPETINAADVCVAGRCCLCTGYPCRCNAATEICCIFDGEPHVCPPLKTVAYLAMRVASAPRPLLECACGALGECGGNSPFCIGTGQARICSECRSNADCDAGGDAPFCNTQLGVCQACLGQDGRCADNPNGEQCITDGERTGQCGECDPGRASGQNGCIRTSANPSCHTERAECVPCTDPGGDACTRHPGDESVCVSEGPRAGRCRECDPFAEPGGTTCDIDSFQPECNPQGNCRECSGNDVCDASTRGGRCSGQSGQCGCNTPADCPDEGQVCRNGACGACIEGAENSLCPPGQVCQAGLCGPCGQNEDCANGEVCIGGVCSQCEQNDDCGAGEACVDGACGPCGGNDECAEGQVCIQGSCGGCDPSAEPTQCDGGSVCNEGVCGPATQMMTVMTD